jgi:hypothetical protein
VVYSIVTAHDGEVDVRSEPGEGTRFIVRLPLGDRSMLESVDGRGQSASEVPRLLLVEPDGRAASRIIEALAEAELEIRHAATVEEAGEVTESWGAHVVVVSSGAAASRPGAGFNELPVIRLTGGDSEPDDTWGPRVIRLESSRGPEEILEALRDLGLTQG